SSHRAIHRTEQSPANPVPQEVEPSNACVADPQSVRYADLVEGQSVFDKKVRDISEDRKTGLVTMTVTWTDPVLAAEWANGLVSMTNDYMRNLAIKQANAEMAYLREQALKTDTVEMKATIYALMERELQKAMVAAGERQFALRVIDPALPPERPSAPKRALWALAALILGFFLSASYVLANAVRTKE